MPAYERRYSEKQLKAFTSAVLDRKLKIREALSLLEAGELGVPGVVMPYTSANTYLGLERKRRRKSGKHPLADGNPGPRELVRRGLQLRMSDWAKARDDMKLTDAAQESLDRRLKLLVGTAAALDAADAAARRASKGQAGAGPSQGSMFPGSPPDPSRS